MLYDNLTYLELLKKTHLSNEYIFRRLAMNKEKISLSDDRIKQYNNMAYDENTAKEKLYKYFERMKYLLVNNPNTEYIRTLYDNSMRNLNIFNNKIHNERKG